MVWPDLTDDLEIAFLFSDERYSRLLNPNTTVDYYLNDHLGSARAMYGSSWSANYYPFGEVASQTGSEEDTHFDFTGQERDHGTGLIYFPRRYYDPEIGRFPTVDPLADENPGLSPYTYVRNNPLILVDPLGLEWYHYQAEGEDEARWHWYEDTAEKEIWTGEYDEDGNKVMQTVQGINDSFFAQEGDDWHLFGAEGTKSQATLLETDFMGNQYFEAKGFVYQNITTEGVKNLWENLVAYGRGGIGTGGFGNLFSKGINFGKWFRWHPHNFTALPGMAKKFGMLGADGKLFKGAVRLTHININKLHIFFPFNRHTKLITGSKWKFWRVFK